MRRGEVVAEPAQVADLGETVFFAVERVRRFACTRSVARWIDVVLAAVIARSVVLIRSGIKIARIRVRATRR